ncbi:MAG: cation:dicarboxylase symporter family transporter [Chlamydiales bacterium]|nr:dicarboxylate/amino acid:cation symporter [Chlamydiales bacterium]NCF70088.1 cation:dicarboxylase symporter family transporter [Chlamydiales bacterium]
MDKKNQHLFLLLSIILGILSAYWGHSYIIFLAQTLSSLFLNFLQLLALPVIFFAVLATVSGMDDIRMLKKMGSKILFYTISTTLIASLVGLLLFTLFSPVAEVGDLQVDIPEAAQKSYLEFFLKIIPPNFIGAFLEYNVVGVVFIAFIIGAASLTLNEESREYLHKTFNSFFSVFLSLTKVIGFLIPFAVWCFVTLLVKEFQDGELDIKLLGVYLLCVVCANLSQGFIVLPLFLRLKGISPLKLFKSMAPALTLAFFSKSSNAALPLTLECAKKRFNVKEQVADVTIPLCSVINMNACAAFILISVLFIAGNAGVVFTWPEKFLWVIISTLAAVGNAGVPMGCYLLTGALLSSMGVPLTLLGLVLPPYALLDMLETSINVWSDSCITAVVDKDLKEVKL